jgi:hypothetical protein
MKINSPIDLVPLAGLPLTSDANGLRCQTRAMASVDSKTFSAALANLMPGIGAA